MATYKLNAEEIAAAKSHKRQIMIGNILVVSGFGLCAWKAAEIAVWICKHV